MFGKLNASFPTMSAGRSQARRSLSPCGANRSMVARNCSLVGFAYTRLRVACWSIWGAWLCVCRGCSVSQFFARYSWQSCGLRSGTFRTDVLVERSGRRNRQSFRGLRRGSDVRNSWRELAICQRSRTSN